jgi:hypothetical protein
VRHVAAAIVLGIFSAATAPRFPEQAPPRDVPGGKPAAAVLRGRIVAAGSDLPVRKARVTLASDSEAPIDPTYCDAAGRFEFTGLPPGRYTVSAWKSGYVPTRFGARTTWDPHVSITLAAGATVDDVELTLAKGAAVAGRVTDELGEPVADVAVTVGRVVVGSGGRMQFQSVASPVTTDDLGEYRIGDLPAGTFIVNAMGWRSNRGPAADRMLPPPLPRPTYYPQVASIAQARPITLRTGEDANGIDVTLGATGSPSVRVSGLIVDPSGQATSYALIVQSTGNDGPQAQDAIITMVPRSGEFALSLSPGEYGLTAESEGGAGRPFAVQRVSVGQSDISGLQLVLSQGARISGRVLFEGTQPRPPGAVAVDMFFSNFPFGMARRQPGFVAANGTFTLTHVVGQAEIRVAQAPRGWSVKSVTAGGRNITDVPIELKGGEDLRDVVIVLTDQLSELNGTVSGIPQGALPPSVLVFADDRRQLPRRAQWVRSDQNGRFVASGLAAGAYLAVALTDVDDIRWSTPEYLDQFRSRATRVSLADGDKKSISLQWSDGR